MKTGLDIANNVGSIIESKGLYQRFVAEKAGFTQQQFSDMLNGRKVIRAEYIPRIADALGVNIGDLFADTRRPSA